MSHSKWPSGTITMYYNHISQEEGHHTRKSLLMEDNGEFFACVVIDFWARMRTSKYKSLSFLDETPSGNLSKRMARDILSTPKDESSIHGLWRKLCNKICFYVISHFGTLQFRPSQNCLPSSNSNTIWSLLS